MGMTWKERFARMKKQYGWSYEQMAEMLNVQPKSIKTIANLSDDKFPNAWKLSVIVFEKEKGLFQVCDETLPMNNPYF